MGDNRSESVYGVHAVEELLKSAPEQVSRVYFGNANTNKAVFQLLKYCRKNRIPYQQVPPNRLGELAQTSKHQGVVALRAAYPYRDADELLTLADTADCPPMFILPAKIEDPRNLGAIMRSAAAFGASGILLERKSTVTLSPTVAKTSAGMIERIGVARPGNLEGLIEKMVDRDYAVVGVSEHHGHPPDELDLTCPLILVLGGENAGIPPYLEKRCTSFSHIPSLPETCSLNVSVAAAIMMYETARQRGRSSL